MRLIFILELCIIGTATASTRGDSLAAKQPYIPSHPHVERRNPIQQPAPRIEHDGVVIGNTKFFILIARPDPYIDFGMIKRIPDSLYFRHTPKEFRRRPENPGFR